MNSRLWASTVFAALLLHGEVMSQSAQPIPPKAVPVDGPAIVDGGDFKGKPSVGLNRQFKVEGESLMMNKKVSSLCNDLASAVHKFLGEKRPDEGFFTINVFLYSKGNAKRANLFSNKVRELDGGGYRLDLVVDIRENIDVSVLESAIMQAIVIERSLQNHAGLGEGDKIEVPLWVSDGLLGAIRWKAGKGKRGMYEVLNRKPDLFPVDRLFKTTQKDVNGMGETLKTLYKVSSTAMMMSILRQPDGEAGVKAMLGEVAVFEGETSELLRKNIPAMNVGTKGLTKLWNLQLAEMAAPRLQDTKTIIQTEEELRGTLFFTLVGKDRLERRVVIEDFDVLLGMEEKERIKTTVFLNQKLIQLGYRAYPDYQPVLAEYGFILTELARGKTDGVAEKLQKLNQERQTMYESGKRTRDVLDWYRISKAKGLNGDFTGYQRLLEQMKREEKREQENDVSNYVNMVEKLMTR